MTTTELDLEFRPLTIPANLDAEGGDAFRAMTSVRNAIYREISGHDDHSLTPEELLPNYQPDEYETRLVWLIVLDGAPIGRVGVDIPAEEGSRVAYALIEILRQHWGLGIGRRAHALIDATVGEHGRDIAQSWAEHPAADGERLASPTGFGSIPRDHIARFYLAQGYTLEQVERASAFDLQGSFERVADLLADAERAAHGYRIVQWNAPTPAEYAEGYAWMKSRMSTDAPAADLVFDEEKWDAARIAVHDARYTDAGRRAIITAAQHIETGELCAFNELVTNADGTGAAHQEDTLVLKEHRGHRLGMLVKCAGLVALREASPRLTRVLTYNAEENRPMLDINETIGFVPIAYEGAWKKTYA